MCANYFSILKSNPIKFLVGPEQREYTIHAYLVAHQSEALKALINGNWREIHEGCVIWEHCDEGTFLRFGQFAYTGHYDGSEPKKRVVKEQPVVSSVAESLVKPAAAKPVPVAVPKFKNYTGTISPEMSKRDSLWKEFSELHPEPAARRPANRNGPDDDCTEVFLSHARMYVFADYYGILALQDLALRMLRRALMRFNLYEGNASDIIQLLE